MKRFIAVLSFLLAFILSVSVGAQLPKRSPRAELIAGPIPFSACKDDSIIFINVYDTDGNPATAERIEFVTDEGKIFAVGIYSTAKDNKLINLFVLQPDGTVKIYNREQVENRKAPTPCQCALALKKK